MAKDAFDTEFNVITTLRTDPLLQTSLENEALSPVGSQKLYMLAYHRDRLLAAAKVFDRTGSILDAEDAVANLGRTIQKHLSFDRIASEPLKIRVSISHNGQLSVEIFKSIPPVPLNVLYPPSLSFLAEPTFRIFISTMKTTPDLFTAHKTTHRAKYDEARALLPNPADMTQEILLVNQGGHIMEGSITTPYFLRDGVWITPDRSCGGNLGTTRRYALEWGLCQEGFVDVESVQVGDMVVLSNGVRGFGLGRVEVLPEKKGFTSKNMADTGCQQ